MGLDVQPIFDHDQPEAAIINALLCGPRVKHPRTLWSMGRLWLVRLTIEENEEHNGAETP